MSKLNQLTKSFEQLEIDALIITNPINRRYITGFTGTAGVAIVSNKGAIFITDFRYIEQATEQAKDFTIVEHTKAIEQEINNQLQKLNIQKVGFEKDDMTYGSFERYRKFITAELIPVSNVVEQQRLIKNQDEINILKQAGEIADAAFDHILSYIKPGVREIEIANELEFFMRK